MKHITLDNYSETRDLTRNISEHIQSRITGHLDTVKNHFRPSSVFGSYMSGSMSSAQENPKNASAEFAQFTALYKQIAVPAPMNLDPKLPEAIEINFATPLLCPFIYEHHISTPAGTKRLTVTVPFRFVLAFPGYSFSDLRSLVNSRGPKDRLREFVLHYTVLNFMAMRNKRLLSLFDDLRFPIRSECFEEYGTLPLTMISAPAGSVLPPDAVVAQVCRFSGADTAEELADFEGWDRLADPLEDLFREEATKFTTGANAA